MRAGIEERRRGGAGALVLVNAVEFLRARLAFRLKDGQAHRHAHPEDLRRLNPAAAFRTIGVLDVDQVPVVEILDADEIELEIGVGIDRVGQFLEAEFPEARIETAHLDAERDVLQERLAMRFLQLIDAVAIFHASVSS